MILERVTCAGLPPIEGVSVSISAEEGSRTASLDLAVIGMGVPVSIGQPVVLRAGKHVVLTGYVRDVNPAHDAESHTLQVNLVSRTIDYVECSADHPRARSSTRILPPSRGSWIRRDRRRGQRLVSKGAAAQDRAGRKAPSHRSSRRARGRGVLIHDTEKGRLKLSTKPEGTHSGGWFYGRNILAGSASFTEQGRY